MHSVYYETAHHSIQKLFTKKAQGMVSTRNQLKFEVKRFKSEAGRRSFRYRGAMLWNAIPDLLKQITNLTTFKQKLKTELKLINDFNFDKEAIMINNKRENFTYF